MQLSQVATDIAVSGVCVGFAFIAILFSYAGMCELSKRWKNLSKKAALQAERERISNYLFIMDRWLCYDFPVVEDLRDWLNSYIHDARVEAIGPDQLRDKLRKKYGARTS